MSLLETLTRLHRQTVEARDRHHRLSETYRHAMTRLRLGEDEEMVLLALQKNGALPARQSGQVISWEDHERISADGP